MADFNNIDDCENELADFSAKTNAAFWIVGQQRLILSIRMKWLRKFLLFQQIKQLHLMKMNRSIDMQLSGATTTNFYPITLKNGAAYTLVVQTGFVCRTAGNKSIAVHISVCYPNGLSAFSPLCRALYTVHHSTYCATEQDFKANGGTGFFWSMYCCAGR